MNHPIVILQVKATRTQFDLVSYIVSWIYLFFGRKKKKINDDALILTNCGI